MQWLKVFYKKTVISLFNGCGDGCVVEDWVIVVVFWRCCFKVELVHWQSAGLGCRGAGFNPRAGASGPSLLRVWCS